MSTTDMHEKTLHQENNNADMSEMHTKMLYQEKIKMQLCTRKCSIRWFPSLHTDKRLDEHGRGGSSCPLVSRKQYRQDGATFRPA